MLYLAEVIQKKGGLVGGGKSELKLLACQRSEQNWSAITGDETIPADDKTLKDGALVLVDVGGNKQIQRIQDAGRQIASILQKYSRDQEKYKNQEEEIEQWKQSLTYQGQEFNRREMEMEARREELQQMEERLQHVDQQQKEIEAAREECKRLQEQYERKSQELEGAWEQFRGDVRRFEERQHEAQQSAGLDAEQARAIQEHLDRLAGTVIPLEAVREQLNYSYGVLDQQQTTLNHHWQQLEQHRGSAQQLQMEVDRQGQDIHDRWQEWHRSQEAFEQAKSELKVQQTNLALKRDYSQQLSLYLQNQEDIYQQIYQLAEATGNIPTKVDVETLEKMPIEDLQRVVQDLEKSFRKDSSFVDDQEQELLLKQEEIEAMQKEQEQHFDMKRQEEIAEEQEAYDMLLETLEGQRRTLREKGSTLKVHQMVLARRTGQGGDEPDQKMDLAPVMDQLEAKRQQYADELQHLENQIEQMKNAIQQAEGLVVQQAAELEAKRNEIKQMEQNLLGQRATVAELWGKVNLYQEQLQPLQDHANALRQKLDDVNNALNQIQGVSDYQLHTISDMRQTLFNLMGSASAA